MTYPMTGVVQDAILGAYLATQPLPQPPTLHQYQIRLHYPTLRPDNPTGIFDLTVPQLQGIIAMGHVIRPEITHHVEFTDILTGATFTSYFDWRQPNPYHDPTLNPNHSFRVILVQIDGAWDEMRYFNSLEFLQGAMALLQWLGLDWRLYIKDMEDRGVPVQIIP